MVICKFFYAKPTSDGYCFFATGRNKIITYDIPTEPSMLVKERFPLSLFLQQKAATLLIDLVFIH